jgi:peptidoglycan hydrolase-like protein with peptidoglycan-binding domain
VTLPSAPPRYGSWADVVAPIRRGEDGWRVFALQRGLQRLNYLLDADGDFGPLTEAIVKQFQSEFGTLADGVAGMRTQAKMLERCSTRVHRERPGVPDGLMRGFAEGEGANVLAATNWTVPGGVDCGCMQWRVYGPPYDIDDLRSRFDPLGAMNDTAVVFLQRVEQFRNGRWVAGREDRAKRCAVMAHNWPVGAASIAATGTCSSPSSPCTWVAAGTKFPDGTPVRTRWEWCQFYAMGGAHGEGSITRYVTDWS